jgi:hypothetical protein
VGFVALKRSRQIRRREATERSLRKLKRELKVLEIVKMEAVGTGVCF